MQADYAQMPIEELLKKLASSMDKGVSQDVAQQRLAEQQAAAKVTTRFGRELRLLAKQYTNPLVLLLVIAVLLSAFLGETADTLIILFILLISGLLGFWQELNAGKAVERLQQMIRLKIAVVREGQQLELDIAQIVPGDVLLLSAGNIIPADCRVLESNELYVNESSITGESYPIEKSAGVISAETPISGKTNCLWQGTNVISGTGKALVVKTGQDTVFGQMAHSLVKDEETAFEKGIRRFGYFLMQITIILSIIILSVNLYFRKPLFESILFALAIAVGMAPELLPAIMTFAMSAGAKRLLKKKVIVKKLSSIFSFGEVNVLCTDKTGTLTEGSIRVKEVINAQGKQDGQVKLYAFLNASMQNGFANPIDDAIRRLNDVATDDYRKINEVPYDFIRRRLSVAVASKGEQLLITKGAVDNILEICSSVITADGNNAAIDKDQVRAFYADYCNRGYRLIGLAVKNITGDEKVDRADEQDMSFAGFVVLEDPLKEGIIDSLERLKQLNVSVKIITGDNRYVAAYVAREIGITTPKIITGAEMNDMLSEAFTVHAAQADVFAEVEPHQKERIIRALQKSHFAIAYMGDGINDVAAIHAADTGISTNNAVDVAKEAADFVLLEKDLSVLADGIHEGRKTFANSLKYIFITTGATFGNMFSVAVASLLLPFLPMLPKQILLTNFLTDFPFVTVAADNVDAAQTAKPGKWDMKLIRNFMLAFGIHSSIFDFLTFYMLYHVFHLSNAPFQTGWFIESIFTELAIIFVIRTRKPFLKSRPGKWMMLTSLIAMMITALLPLSPFAGMLGLTIAHFGEAIALALIILAYALTADLLKLWFFRKLAKA